MHSKLETKIDSISTISKLELDSFRSELESNRRAMEETAKGTGCKQSVTFLFIHIFHNIFLIMFASQKRIT